MIISSLIDTFLHIDEYLGAIISAYGPLTYSILFLVIFIETGLVIMPFLPGDSLLFAAGAFASLKSLNIFILLIIFSLAAILGDSVNYWMGKKFGRKLFTKEKSKFFNKSHLEKTEKFYEKYGAKTIILARFIPIIRTFAPFVAGMGTMKYPRFLVYNIIGGICWVFLFVLVGYFFGNVPLVKQNFSMVIIAIILISVIPILISLINSRKNKKH
jgi:membrane-associated protein